MIHLKKYNGVRAAGVDGEDLLETNAWDHDRVRRGLQVFETETSPVVRAESEDLRTGVGVVHVESAETDLDVLVAFGQHLQLGLPVSVQGNECGFYPSIMRVSLRPGGSFALRTMQWACG